MGSIIDKRRLKRLRTEKTRLSGIPGGLFYDIKNSYGLFYIIKPSGRLHTPQ
jgi:hypothetical protein